MKIRLEVVGTTPVLMHNPQMVDPEFEINRQIKALTSKRKKTDEDLKQIEKLEWYGGLYLEQVNGKQILVHPTAKFRKCLIEAATINKMGKAVQRAVSFMTLNTPLIYEGPKDIDKLYLDPQFRSRLSVRIGNKRIMRVRPRFMPWAHNIDGIFIEDAGLNFDELERIAELAGIVQGIGDNRVNGYGRFTAKVVAL